MTATNWLIHALPAVVDSFWMPPQASTVAAETDALFNFILWLCVIFFVLLMGAMAAFMVLYRRRHEGQKTSPVSQSHKLELAWSVIPSILLVVIFVWGAEHWMTLNVPPADSMDIRVSGQKWTWSFDYPAEGINSPDLVVPVNQPVRLTMHSRDILHSFFVPAFRIKRDVIPNRYSVVWFEAIHTGEYDVQCTEYCGTNHSRMLSKVRVVSTGEYQEWLKSQKKTEITPEEGEKLFNARGCNACHSTQDIRLVGPSMKGLWGKTEKMTDGSSALVDDNYVRQSILDPTAKVVEGFAPVMPSYKGQLTDEQISAIIEFMKSIGQ